MNSRTFPAEQNICDSAGFPQLGFLTCLNGRARFDPWFFLKSLGAFFFVVLLMVEIRLNQLRLVVVPVIYRVLAPFQVVSRISEPSTVSFESVFQKGAVWVFLTESTGVFFWGTFGNKSH